MITLKTLPQATAQEVFDQCATHLLAQGRKARTPEHSDCVYRNADGLKCAAGCFIGDDEYEPSFEGKTWYGLIRAHLVPRVHPSLITDLQWVHDGTDVSEWPERLRRIAAYHHLEVHFP